jgi:hypothetical protein
LINELGGVASFSEFRDANENSQLTDILTNNKSLEKIMQKGDILVRKDNPVYMEPTSKIGRAHLYAPYKQVGNTRIDTLWYNVMVIWFTCLLLYITLYTDALRKSLEFVGRMKIRKPFRA